MQLTSFSLLHSSSSFLVESKVEREKGRRAEEAAEKEETVALAAAVWEHCSRGEEPTGPSRTPRPSASPISIAILRYTDSPFISSSPCNRLFDLPLLSSS